MNIYPVKQFVGEHRQCVICEEPIVITPTTHFVVLDGQASFVCDPCKKYWDQTRTEAVEKDILNTTVKNVLNMSCGLDRK